MRRFLFIGFRICGRDIPAEHTAVYHRLFLGFGDSPFLVVVVRNTAVPLRIAGVPLRRVIALLSAYDADERAKCQD